MIIFGSSGHAREIYFFLNRFIENQKYAHSYFVSKEIGELNNIAVISEDALETILETEIASASAIVGIGDGIIRKKIAEKFKKYNNLIFPNILFNYEYDFKCIGSGNVFFPTFYTTTGASIGSHNHFNLKSSISHDVTIGDYNTFSPNVTLAGNVAVADNVFFGVGASVIDNVSICSNVTIGAGAVVVGDINAPGTYVGVPAKRIK